jgi:hypothetical protein
MTQASNKRESDDKRTKEKPPESAPFLPDEKIEGPRETVTSPRGDTYEIIHSPEHDPYDPPTPPLGPKRSERDAR